jgi:aminoglycoside 2''-phosphotransferase
MSDLASQLRSRIHALMPELEIERLEVNQEGLVNDVAVVNGEWVFRFAKNQRAREILARELKILDLVRPRLAVEVPTPVYGDREVVVYRYLHGEPLLRETIYTLAPGARSALAAQLGVFLHRLHATPTTGPDGEIAPTPAHVTREQIVERYARVRKKIYPLLLGHQVQWAERLFDGVLSSPDALTYKPALIHGDLAPYHILYHPPRNCINGVLDFGVAGLGDPALDVGSLITSYGERFVALCQSAYPGLEQLLPRARFYAQAIELEWVLLGLETGERFWFTAHLGGARDVSS